MSILTHSPAIVRDGLVLCLDAAAVRSYPGAGPQLVVNGDFASDITTGWEAGDSTTGQSHDTGGDGGRLKIVGSVTGRLYSSAAITTVVGQKYRFSCSVTGTSTNHFVHCGTSKGSSNLLTNFTLGSADGTYVWDFVATDATFYIHLGATGSSTQYFDQVSLVAIASNLSLPGDSGFSSGVSYGVPGANQWRDLSGNNHHGTLTNMQYHLDAESGAGGTRSFDFDGTSDGVIMTGNTGLNTWEGATTIAAWIKPNGTPAEWDGIYSDATTGPSGTSFNFGTSGVLRLSSDSGSPQVNSTGAVTINEWNYVVVSYDGTTVTFYINGANAGGGGSYSQDAASTADVDIGQYYGGALQLQYRFDGRICVVQHYNRGLTATEVAQNYRTHKGRFGL